MTLGSIIKHKLMQSFPLRQWVGLRADVADSLALQQLAPLSHGYLPWSDSSIRPSALVTILNDIILNRRSLVVECGGGISTIFIAQLLTEIGQGRLITFEHDEAWRNLLEEKLGVAGVKKHVELVHAPLTPNPEALGDTLWYDKKVVDSALQGKKIDLLLVDGPPAYGPGMSLSRFPAIPCFKKNLANQYGIYLDDINRSGELEILLRWSKLLGLPFNIDLVGGGVGIIRAGQARTV